MFDSGTVIERSRNDRGGDLIVNKKLSHSQIESTDKEIDALVYQLYELMDEEIRVVEGE